MHSWHSIHKPRKRGVTRHSPYAEKDLNLFGQVVKRAEHVVGKTESRIEGIKHGHEDPIVALLLLLLINLRSLVVEQMENGPQFFQTLQCVSSAQSTDALGRLSK